MRKAKSATIHTVPAKCVRNGLSRSGLPILLASAALLFGGASSAKAQSSSLLPIRIKIGIVNLQDNDARNIAGSPLYMAEADLFLPASGGGGRSMFTAGYQMRSAHGNRIQVIPLTISKTSSLANPAATVTGNLYYGLGAGLYLLRGTSDDSTESKTRPGGFAVAGYQFPGSIFAEAKYQYVTGGVKGVNVNGVLFALGKRF